MIISPRTPLWDKIEAVAARNAMIREAARKAEDHERWRYTEAARRRQKRIERAKEAKFLRRFYRQFNGVRIVRTAPKTIRREVVEEFGITLAELIGTRRFKRYQPPKRKFAWRLWSETSLSFSQIAKWLGGKDHTTALHHVRKYIAENNVIELPGHRKAEWK